MSRRLIIVVGLAAGCSSLLAPSALARERVLTLYSPKIHSRPYIHDTHFVTLRPNGREAPRVPGYITGFKEQTLVDSKKPNAKPLPAGKMMVHHFLYWANDRVDQLPGSCWGRTGFIGGRGEEHPSGKFSYYTPRVARRKYGIANRTTKGEAPTWRLTAMVMNHYRRPKDFYVRTRIYYTTDKRKSVSPIVVGNCATVANLMAYDVPGGGRRGSNFVEKSLWTVPRGLNGRLVLAHSHHHGGAKFHTLRSRTCKRTYFKARAYYGRRNHVYNTIRPILHEPGPIANGSYGTLKGIPITEGEVFERKAVHDNANLHVAAMGFWVLMVAKDDSVRRCGPVPKDIRQLGKPKRYTKRPNHGLKVPQLSKPSGPFQAFTGGALIVGDQFLPGRVTARVGQPITWRFAGTEGHSVTVANGPRGFSSLYTGTRRGVFSYTPKVRGTYRLTCLVHPTTMAQTLRVVR